MGQGRTTCTQEVEKEGREGERQERGELEAELGSPEERRSRREGRAKEWSAEREVAGSLKL
jgi:hypothetical protein